MLSSAERQLLRALLDPSRVVVIDGQWPHEIVREYLIVLDVSPAAFDDVCRQLLARVREDRYLDGEGAWRDLDLMERLVLLAAGDVSPYHSLVLQIERITGVDPRNFFPWPERTEAEIQATAESLATEQQKARR